MNLYINLILPDYIQIKSRIYNQLNKITYQMMVMMDHVFDIHLIILSIDHDALLLQIIDHLQ